MMVPREPAGCTQRILADLLVLALVRTLRLAVVFTLVPMEKVPGVGIGVVTVTVAEALAEPPEPLQVMVYVALEDGVTTREPDNPVGEKLVPVQVVALVLVQVRVDD